ncbi:MAG: hypothetical protein GY702_10035 [Desulfobulbaceae bacterium]|nr:hypothetical protein [Desulfobulbaceae bacterium]
MQVKIEQSCPACGAAIELSEDDRLIKCQFCNVNNYRANESGSSFVLPYNIPEGIAEEQMLFVPYLRFKGLIYYVQGLQVLHKIVDTTRIAFSSENSCFPVSLGLRPQTLKLKPVVATVKGKYFRQTVPTRDAFVHATNVLDLFNKHQSDKVYHRAFIGETVSRIYQPYFIKNDCLFDAVLTRMICKLSMLDQLNGKNFKKRRVVEPQFISTMCPACGGLLDGESDSVVLHCSNCSSHWREEKGKFSEVDLSVAGAVVRDAELLPFWKVEFAVKELGIESFGDYIRFTNQPVVLSHHYDSRPLFFLVPAFKMNPKAFLQVASQLTVSQLRLSETKAPRSLKGYPVTLKQGEAVQMIKSIIAATTISREKKFPLLPALTANDPKISLTYIPFVKKSHDFVQLDTSAAIQTAALKYGRSL